MKLNRNTCLIVLFSIILLYSCLGTTTLEGLVSSKDSTPPASATDQSASNKDAEVAVQDEKDSNYPNTEDNLQTEEKGYSKGFLNQLMSKGSGTQSRAPSLAKKIQSQGIEEANKMKLAEAMRDNREGLGCPPGYHKNRDNACTLKPDDYNHSCDKGFVWNEATGKCKRALGPGGEQQPDHGCPKGKTWDHHTKKCVPKCPPGMEWTLANKCVHSKFDKCPPNEYWDDNKQKCVRGGPGKCPHGMKWDHKNNKCVHKKQSDDTSSSGADSDSGDDSWDLSKFWGNGKHHKDHHHKQNGHVSTYPQGSEVNGSQIPPGQENMYILRSKIVPPVCPACPPVLACPSKAKCAPCPRPPAIQPCPPCARCPEPNFDCKKVPNYKNPSLIPQGLPRPLLNDFSQFT